jgi:hypothetical protein
VVTRLTCNKKAYISSPGQNNGNPRDFLAFPHVSVFNEGGVPLNEPHTLPVHNTLTSSRFIQR